MAISESTVRPSNATLFTPVSDCEIEWAWGSGGGAESVYWAIIFVEPPLSSLSPFCFCADRLKLKAFHCDDDDDDLPPKTELRAYEQSLPLPC